MSINHDFGIDESVVGPDRHEEGEVSVKAGDVDELMDQYQEIQEVHDYNL